MDNVFDFLYNEEICCDYCNSAIHTHFDCPACKEYCGTNYVRSGGDLEVGDTFECDGCKAGFEYLGAGKIKLL